MKKLEDIRKTLGYDSRPINGCHYLDKHFRNNLKKCCLVYKDRQINFEEFMMEVGAWITTLEAQGLKKGDRVIILTPIRVELYEIMCAIFYMGLVVVSIDSTMPKEKIKQALSDAKAQAIISVKDLLRWTAFLPSLWKLKRYTFDEPCLFTKQLLKLKGVPTLEFTQVPIKEDGPVLISFTSGSTGRPKAANRGLDIFLSQKIVSEYFWPHKQDEVDMPFFPTLVLQNLGLGITTIFPDMDFRNIVDFEPHKVINQMNEYGVTRFSATPMIIKKLANYIVKEEVKIPTLRSIIIGGAEITTKSAKNVLEAFKFASPQVDIHIIYGSTEVEPISFTPIEEYIENNEIGLNLGQVIDVLDVKIREIENGYDFNEGLRWGEICLSGPHVIKEYIDNHPANKTTKIVDEKGVTWHLTGDVGYLKNNRIFLLGRAKDCLNIDKHLVPTFYYENELAKIEGVQRGALVEASGKLVCLLDGKAECIDEIKYLLKKWNLDKCEIRFGKIPVDERHFSRVNRNEIRRLL